MFAVQRLLLFCSVCFSLGDVNVELDNFEQKWTTVSETVPFEKYNALINELFEKRVELEKFKLLLDASKVQKELNDAHRERERTILQDNCELRINLAAQNATLRSECLQKLENCDRNMKSAEDKSSKFHREVRAHTRMLMKEDLTKLATGYYYISDENDKTTWFIAYKRCRGFGLELVSIETKEENDALIKALVIDENHQYWMSGTDQGSEGQFYWASTGYQIDIYHDFDNGQPDNYGNNQHCLLYWKLNKKWHDIACNYNCRYICEYKRT